MAASPEQARANLQEALKSPNIGKRGPGKATLDKEEARKIYLERMSQDWEDILKVHIKEAKNPDNVVERKEAIHQFIGKPVEKVEVEQTTTLKVDV